VEEGTRFEDWFVMDFRYYTHVRSRGQLCAGGLCSSISYMRWLALYRVNAKSLHAHINLIVRDTTLWLHGLLLDKTWGSSN